MIDIKDFFKKFSKIHADNLESSGRIITAVKNVSGLIIESKDFAFNNGILRFNLNPVMKNEILMRKEKLLFELNSLGSLIKDVR